MGVRVGSPVIDGQYVKETLLAGSASVFLVRSCSNKPLPFATGIIIDVSHLVRLQALHLPLYCLQLRLSAAFPVLLIWLQLTPSSMYTAFQGVLGDKDNISVLITSKEKGSKASWDLPTGSVKGSFKKGDLFDAPIIGLFTSFNGTSPKEWAREKYGTTYDSWAKFVTLAAGHRAELGNDM
jgi:hypothetical protein